MPFMLPLVDQQQVIWDLRVLSWLSQEMYMYIHV